MIELLTVLGVITAVSFCFVVGGMVFAALGILDHGYVCDCELCRESEHRFEQREQCDDPDCPLCY